MKRYDCTARATSILLNCSLEEIHEFVGHDGSEIVNPNLRSPYCYRGFAMEEMIDFALSKGVALVEITALPEVSPDGKEIRQLWDAEFAESRFRKYLERYDGLLVGTKIGRPGSWHTVAWVDQMCHDTKVLSSISIDPAVFYAKLNSK